MGEWGSRGEHLAASPRSPPAHPSRARARGQSEEEVEHWSEKKRKGTRPVQSGPIANLDQSVRRPAY